MSLAAAGVLACLIAGGAVCQSYAQGMSNGTSKAGISQAGNTFISDANAVAGGQQGQSQQTGSPNGTSGANRRSSRNARTRSARSVPAANGGVEIIGSGSGIKTGTLARPLLPIASLGNQAGIRSGTPILVRLTHPVDSAHVHNGDLLDATLAQAAGTFAAGTPVKLTVVQASPAGALLSFGELSLQVVSIGGKPVLSDTISAQGKEGKKDQADSAPALGTEAGFSAGEVITLPAS